MSPELEGTKRGLVFLFTTYVTLTRRWKRGRFGEHSSQAEVTGKGARWLCDIDLLPLQQ